MSTNAANTTIPVTSSAPRPAPNRPVSRGPVMACIGVAVTFFFWTFSSVFLGTLFEIVGSYTLWPDQGAVHAKSGLEEDLGYIRQFPRSILVADTEAFARDVAAYARWPLDKIGVPQLFARAAASDPASAKNVAVRFLRRGLIAVTAWVEIFYYVLQDTAVRLCVAYFALPAFLLAVLVGLIDGLVQRDLRKWCGGRESSYVYHHAKHYTLWCLTGGFALYLAWPLHGFNPAYMVLVFTVLVAASLSLTVSKFKKYL